MIDQLIGRVHSRHHTIPEVTTRKILQQAIIVTNTGQIHVTSLSIYYLGARYENVCYREWRLTDTFYFYDTNQRPLQFASTYTR